MRRERTFEAAAVAAVLFLLVTLGCPYRSGTPSVGGVTVEYPAATSALNTLRGFDNAVNKADDFLWAKRQAGTLNREQYGNWNEAATRSNEAVRIARDGVVSYVNMRRAGLFDGSEPGDRVAAARVVFLEALRLYIEHGGDVNILQVPE